MVSWLWLVRQSNQLIQVKDLSARQSSNGAIAKAMKVPPFVVGKLKEQAKLFSLEDLYQMVERVQKLMNRSKAV